MDDLIESLRILAQYQDPTHSPTHCEHDVMCVRLDREPSVGDVERLEALGWHPAPHVSAGVWCSFRFGSA